MEEPKQRESYTGNLDSEDEDESEEEKTPAADDFDDDFDDDDLMPARNPTTPSGEMTPRGAYTPALNDFIGSPRRETTESNADDNAKDGLSQFDDDDEFM